MQAVFRVTTMKGKPPASERSREVFNRARNAWLEHRRHCVVCEGGSLSIPPLRCEDGGKLFAELEDALP